MKPKMKTTIEEDGSITQIPKQCRMDYARQFRWPKNKTAQKIKIYNAKAIDEQNDKEAAKLFTKGLAIIALCISIYITITNPSKFVMPKFPLNSYVSSEEAHAAEIPIITPTATPSATPSSSPKAVTGDETPRQYLETRMLKAGFSSQKISFMERIIGECENRAFNPTLVHTNKDGSKDWGVMQINDKWHKDRFVKLYGSWDLITNYKYNIDYAVEQIMIPQSDFSAWACSSKV